MTRHFRWVAGWAMFMVGAIGVAGGSAQEAAKKAADPLFGLTTIHAFHLEMAESAFAKMQPPPRKGFPGFGPGGPKPAGEKKADPAADSHKSAGAFGTEFPWVRADFRADGKLLPNVGVRYKGNFTYVASAHLLRRPLKIDLDHFNEEHRLHGQRKINLSNGVNDPARTREALAFAVYRAAGVPASRTTYAELTLTVPGKFDKEYVGLYTVIEQVDKAFLKTHFKNGKGMLLKPENLRGGLEYLGEDWKRYDDKYRPKSEPTKEQQQRLIAFTRLINKADDAAFRKEVGSFLDIDAFVRFLACDALMCNLDSFLGFGHNFYLYLRPDTNQFVFIPWDLDLSMGMWPVGGSPQQQIDLSLDHPHIGSNKLIDRLLALQEVKAKYTKVLKELTTTCFTKENLGKEIDALEQAVREPLAREKKAAAARKETAKGGFAGIVAPAPPLRVFVEKRTESALAQLAGTRKGYVAAGMGFGPPGGFQPKGPGGGFGPGKFSPGVFLAKPLLATLDTSKDGKLSRDELVLGVKKFFQDCDKENKGSLNEAQIAAGINRIIPRPTGFPAPQPAGFGFGNLVAGSIVKRADVNQAGKVTLDELVAAAETLFKEADTDKKGQLDESAISTGIQRLMPPRPGFGPKLEQPKKDDKKAAGP